LLPLPRETIVFDLRTLYRGDGKTNNNRNVLSQTITVPSVGETPGFVATQTYSYDSLNRLKQATEMITPHGGSQSLSWRQTYTFDRYGNRRFDTTNNNTTTLPKNCGTPQNPTVCPEDVARLNPEINPANNRLSSPGWQYDAAGNTIRDAEGRSFIYDGENKQVEVKNSQNQVISKYYFDGDGKRVKKIVPSTGETTVFVYDASNKLVAEYSTIVEPQETAKVSYLTNDHLGSPRITSDAIGQVVSRRDFMPYGEEIVSPQRTQSLGYTADTIRQKFTGYERDNEINLDYAKARIYTSSSGRFTNPDPYNIVMVAANERELNIYVKNAQIWNRYTYALNNPLRLVDPDGLNPQPVFDWNRLNDDERRILENTRMVVQQMVGENLEPVEISGQQLFNHLAENRPDALAGFLNQTAQLSSITFEVGGQTRTALSFVQRVVGFAPDRVYAEVDPQLKTLIANDRRFSSAPGHDGFPDSWKHNRSLKGNLQLSFSKDGSSVDADTDLYNMKVKTKNPLKKIVGVVGHGIEVLDNRGDDVTNPISVYKVLIDRGLKVSYTLKD
jgi:RHS repeat-associated protein